MQKKTKVPKMVGVDQVIQFVVGFALLVLIAAAIAIALGSFRDTTTANSFEYNITNDGLSGVDNVSNQFSSIGTMVGVGLLIAVVLGVFGYGYLRNRED